MSKLFKLKEWLTIADTAKYLSNVFDEEVTEADVLRLGLDRKLTLSVNFVNHTYARQGKIIPWLETDWFLTDSVNGSVSEKTIPMFDQQTEELPIKLAELYSIHSHELLENSIPILKNKKIAEDQYIALDTNIDTISGVWDLLMVGGDELDLEHRYQMLTNGVDITLTNIDGVFVQLEGIVSQLMDGMRPDFYPAGRLPTDSILVVKTSAITDLLNSLTDKPLSARERNSMLTVIAALLIQAKFDPKQRGTTGALVKCTEILGSPLSDGTVKKILNQINDIGFNKSL